MRHQRCRPARGTVVRRRAAGGGSLHLDPGDRAADDGRCSRRKRVDIDVLLDPDLMEGHTLSYIIDGKEMAKGLRANRVRITDLDRGTHHLEVAVRDEAGGSWAGPRGSPSTSGRAR